LAFGVGDGDGGDGVGGHAFFVPPEVHLSHVPPFAPMPGSELAELQHHGSCLKFSPVPCLKFLQAAKVSPLYVHEMHGFALSEYARPSTFPFGHEDGVQSAVGDGVGVGVDPGADTHLPALIILASSAVHVLEVVFPWSGSMTLSQQ
jgi:hypothetical protein